MGVEILESLTGMLSSSWAPPPDPPTPRLQSVPEFSLSHTALLFRIKLPI